MEMETANEKDIDVVLNKILEVPPCDEKSIANGFSVLKEVYP